MRRRISCLDRIADFPRPRIRAFTLVELLTAIAVVAILAGIVIGAAGPAATTAKVARARAELAVIAAALDGYRRHHGDYPRTADAAAMLQALLGRKSPAMGDLDPAGPPWLDLGRFTTGGAVEATAGALLDPWDQPYGYLYRTPPSGWSNPAYILWSAGPDERYSAALLAGGFPDEDDAANLDNLYASP